MYYSFISYTTDVMVIYLWPVNQTKHFLENDDSNKTETKISGESRFNASSIQYSMKKSPKWRIFILYGNSAWEVTIFFKLQVGINPRFEWYLLSVGKNFSPFKIKTTLWWCNCNSCPPARWTSMFVFIFFLFMHQINRVPVDYSSGNAQTDWTFEEF